MKPQFFKSILISFLLVSSQMKLVSQSINYAINDTMFVYAFNGLNIREQQNMKAKVIEKIEFGQKVQILEIPENAYDNAIEIENITGNWLLVKYNNTIGYAFDGYLSKLPNTPFPSVTPLFKHFDKANEDGYEGHQMEAELTKYLETYYKPLCETVEYFDPKKGKGGQKLEITKLQNGYTKIIKVGWEGYAMELLLPKIRLSEVKNLILYIARKAIVYPNTYKEINESLLNINEHSEYQEILNLSMFWISIIKYPESDTWSIEFSVAVS